MAAIHGKSKSGLSVRQRKLIKARVEGKTLKEAAEVAGYANAITAHESLKNLNANGKLCAALERAGISDDKLAKTLAEQLEATKLYGKEAIEAPDNSARLSAVDISIKTKGAYAPTKTDVKGEINLVPVMDLIEQLQAARVKKAIGHDEAV